MNLCVTMSEWVQFEVMLFICLYGSKLMCICY